MKTYEIMVAKEQFVKVLWKKVYVKSDEEFVEIQGEDKLDAMVKAKKMFPHKSVMTIVEKKED